MKTKKILVSLPDEYIDAMKSKYDSTMFFAANCCNMTKFPTWEAWFKGRAKRDIHDFLMLAKG